MPEVLERLRSWLAAGDLSCTVSDALGRTGALSAAFRPVWASACMVGPAVTVRTFGTDLSAVFDAIALAAPGSVIVIDSHGIVNSAFWGERTTRAALGRKLAGAVIDGACRDVGAVRRLGFPVFSTAITPNAGLPGGRGAVNVPVQVGGVPVLPGDLVVADENGVVIVPQAQIQDTVHAVANLLQAERLLFEATTDALSLRPEGGMS